jgi:hypothetical protein
MKRIILIATIALLPVLSACFVCRVPIDHGEVKTKLVPKVSEYGTLIGLKDDKGRRLFKKPIQEGFYVRYRVGDSKEEHIFYALGDRISNQKAKYSGYQEKIFGAGATTQYGLNVTSWFVIDKNNRTLKAMRTFVNLSNATIYLSEVKDYVDTHLLPLRTEMGKTTKVAPLRTETNIAIRSNLTTDPGLTNPDCWPCQNWPDCVLEFALPDPTRATVICINCEKGDAGVVHVVCLAELQKELDEYRAEGCEHLITYIGIDARRDRPLTDEGCRQPSASDISPLTLRTLATGQKPSEIDVNQALTLPARAAFVIATEYEINLKSK